MNPRLIAVALGLAAAACAPLERSRSLNDPAVPARAMAMQVCSNCHGVDGNSISPNFPKLAGQTRPYIKEQLKAFRSHGRLDPAGFEYMWGLSRHLSDAQIDGLADYYASQHTAPNRPGVAALAADGKSIFDSGIAASGIPPCSSCHGAGGAGNEQFPRLAGQHADYLEKQLAVFQRTDQRPEGAVMKVIAHNLTPHDIQAVSNYLQGIVAN